MAVSINATPATVESSLNRPAWHAFAKKWETKLAESGMTNLELTFNNVSIATSRYTPAESTHRTLSNEKTISFIRNRRIPPTPLASPFDRTTKGTTKREGSDESTRTLSLAERGKTVESSFKTGEIVRLGSVPSVDTDYTFTSATRGTAFRLARTCTTALPYYPPPHRNNFEQRKPTAPTNFKHCTPNEKCRITVDSSRPRYITG